MPPDALNAGIVDLTSYFAGTESPETPAVSDPVTPPESHLEDAAGVTADAPVPDAPVVDPLDTPEVQAAVERKLREALEARERAAREEAQRKYLESLPDDQYGRVMRQHVANIAREQTALEAAKVAVYQEGLTGAMKAIPELANLTTEETAKFDPRKFPSFAEFAGAMIQHAAEVRAKKLAEPLAKTHLEALKASELAKLQAEYPTAPRPGPSGPDALGVDTSKMSGIDLLRASFQ